MPKSLLLCARVASLTSRKTETLSYLCAGRKRIVVFLAQQPVGKCWEESKTFNVILDQQPLELLEQSSLTITY